MDRWVGCPPTALGVKGAGLKLREGGEPAHDATVTMSPFWNCPTLWHHDFGCLHLAFCLPAGIYLGFRLGGGGGGGVWGECLPGARLARYFSIKYPDFSPRFTLSLRSPPSRPRWTAHLPSKARCKKAIAVNSTTPNVICIVLNKKHWSHKCGCQYIQHNNALHTHHKL